MRDRRGGDITLEDVFKVINVSGETGIILLEQFHLYLRDVGKKLGDERFILSDVSDRIVSLFLDCSHCRMYPWGILLVMALY